MGDPPSSSSVPDLTHVYPRGILPPAHLFQISQMFFHGGSSLQLICSRSHRCFSMGDPPYSSSVPDLIDVYPRGILPTAHLFQISQMFFYGGSSLQLICSRSHRCFSMGDPPYSSSVPDLTHVYPRGILRPAHLKVKQKYCEETGI